MTKIKICGLTSENDIEAVNAVKPDYAGFVFAESRRQVTPELARKLRALLDPGIIPVGVFVNAAPDTINGLFNSGVIQYAQLHGGESEEYIYKLRERGIPIIQAIRDGRGDTISDYANYHLFDAKQGGGGTVFNWDNLPDTGKAFFLAGGIGLHNIQAALKLQPYAIDISSGAETDGIKNAEKIKQLVAACRGEARLAR
ncbi:MAG: phosphoribosylanthranilate isomerase [Oscillospiraceae bacterium]|jgi:phosphoribosylanthranilate isomerase|nr:phosphoribosylanthranilate isomerase [Oscillospiraceae bacterium]